MSYRARRMRHLIDTGQVVITPFNDFKYDKNGWPVSVANTEYFELTENARELRLAAMQTFCHKYPPMAELPITLPTELQVRDLHLLEKRSKGGYYLHYGFLVTPDQSTELLRHLRAQYPTRWTASMYDRHPIEAVREAISVVSKGNFDHRRLWYARTLQGHQENSTHSADIIALYSNGAPKIDQRQSFYTPQKEQQVIRWISDVVSPVTKQKEPMWYWDAARHK
ncbi:hypothetical protein OH77DRAFT_1439217 [Trametes cingulata]|nr:hypothetical protein OH77DRAFT_1439217 [Trametes cingulata]